MEGLIRSLIKDIEDRLYKEVTLMFESVQMGQDRFGHTIYKDGGREKVKSEIREEIKKLQILAGTCADTKEINIIDVLINAIKVASPDKCYAQKQEMINILNELEQEQKEQTEGAEQGPNVQKNSGQENIIG